MCGIFGFTNFKNQDLEKARELLSTLEHRGPDQWNDFYDKNIYMGHQRLSILDLSDHGKQPMKSFDNNVVITVNGEIYNFLELRKKLENKYTFQSASDSEVVLYGYMEWGIDKLLEVIDGMYAITIYDKLQNKLFLIRDRVGIKPLYWAKIDDKIVWSSELKAIEKFFPDLKIDNTALYDFLTYKYIPTPKTMYKNVNKLEPAHFLEIDIKSNQYQKKKYWEINNFETSSDNILSASKKVRNLLKKSIDEQMIADVPVGFFLSGGIDSSIVVANASLEHNNINTFSIGFSDKSHDETKYAEIVAKKFQTKHFVKILDESATLNLLENIKKWYDEPFADNSCFPTYLVSKFAKDNNMTVVLTGDGGDEIFGGYKWYKKFNSLKRLKYSSKILKLINMFKNKSNFLDKIIRRIELYFLDDLELYTKLMGGLIKSEKKNYRKLFNINEEYDDYWYFRKFYKKELNPYTRLQYLDFNTFLPDDILTKVDRVSMAVSLECRVPFLSKDIIEYSFSLNERVRLYNNELKGILKEAYKDILPYDILYREKKGFSIPLHNWQFMLKNQRTFQEEVFDKFFLKSCSR